MLVGCGAPIAQFATDADLEPHVLPRLTVGSGTVHGLDVSPDGRLLASVHTVDTLQLWRIDDHGGLTPLGEEVHVTDRAVLDVWFSPDSKQVLIEAGDGLVYVLRVASGFELVNRFELAGTERAAFAADSSHVVIATEQGDVHRLAIDDKGPGAPTWRLGYNGKRVQLSRDGSRLAVTDTKSSERRFFVLDERGGSRELAISDDLSEGELAVLYGRGGDPMLWRVTTDSARFFEVFDTAAFDLSRGYAVVGEVSGRVHMGRLTAGDVPGFKPDWTHVHFGLLYGEFSTPEVRSVAVDPTGRWVFAGGRTGDLRTLSFGPQPARDVLVGGDRIRWEPAPRVLHDPPRLAVALDVMPLPDDALDITIRVANTGAVPAFEVISLLNLEPERGRDVNRRIFVGTVRPGEQVVRHLRASAPMRLGAGRVFRVNVHTRSAGGYSAPAEHYLFLPRLATDAAAYDRMAQRIFGLAVAELRKLTGVAGFDPRLKKLNPDQFGFFAGGAAIMYQNPYELLPAGRAVNRRVTASRSEDELTRHADMMLLWYIPHEVVHAARNFMKLRKTNWYEEWVANTVQPALTARLLEQLPDLGYTARAFDWIYEHYATRLRSEVSAMKSQSTDRFIASRGESAGLNARGSGLQVLQNAPVYVWWGARINQAARAGAATLEELIRIYLSAPSTPP